VTSRPDAPVEALGVAAYRIPTEQPESDGTYEWDATTLVVVEVNAGGRRGLGYTYADVATAMLVHDRLAGVVTGCDAFDIPRAHCRMQRALRNLGVDGIGAMAISAVDVALWDLKATLLGVSLAALLGRARPAIETYGSGGFTSYPVGELQRRLADWVDRGLDAVKMKVGREPADDARRVRAARAAIGTGARLFVDANGGYARKQALEMAARFDESGVSWFEEPVSSDDLEGLRLLRDHGPPGMDVTAGEYGYRLPYFRSMLGSGAVDVLQADATRCGGVTGFMAVAELCDAFGVPLSSHCAPALHVPLDCAARRAIHLEYFHDHVLIERRYFDGATAPVDGRIAPDAARTGLGLEFKWRDAQEFRL
jgi:L-alanine-DL-glutamate epimerase-like enolase superfamily enzyme